MRWLYIDGSTIIDRHHRLHLLLEIKYLHAFVPMAVLTIPMLLLTCSAAIAGRLALLTKLAVANIQAGETLGAGPA